VREENEEVEVPLLKRSSSIDVSSVDRHLPKGRKKEEETTLLDASQFTE
jgi:hypothetical protein